MKWYKVADKLPYDIKDECEYDYVLVYANNPKGAPSYLFSVAQYKDGKWDILDDSGVHSCSGSYGMTSEMITHWAKLEFPID